MGPFSYPRRQLTAYHHLISSPQKIQKEPCSVTVNFWLVTFWPMPLLAMILLFVFLLNQSPSLSPDRIMLGGNTLSPENHKCLLLKGHALPLCKPGIRKLRYGRGELQALERWREWGQRRGHRRGEAPTQTTGPRGRGCLLNSNGIILFGK